MEPSPALLTDLYELTMLAVYLDEGMAGRPASFSLFVRNLPPERGYLVAAGLGDALDHLERLRFTDEDVAALAATGMFDGAVLDHLAALRFTGSVRAVPEGRLVFANEPLLEVDAPLGVAQLVETYLLNQVTFQTTLATKAARCRHAADGRAVVDFALRRTQGIDAGMKLVRCCRIVGLPATSNVAGSIAYGLPAAGTMAHSLVQAHPDETEAFRAFARRYGDRTTLLVDTYDTMRGVGRAITVAREMRDRGEALAAVRLDSGDLVDLSRRARRMLDEAGFPDVEIFASGGLDEYEIDALLRAGAAIDAFGVGSALGVSKDAPVLDSAYKLVEFDDRPVRKTSEGKVTWPGRKQVWRRPRSEGDVLATIDEPGPDGAEPLLVEVMRDGVRTPAGADDLDAARERFEADWAALPEGVKRLTDADPYPVEVSTALRALADRIEAAGH